MSSDNTHQPSVALVTAASRGIGAATARELAGDGYRVCLMARSAEVLALAEELGGTGMVGSVTEPADLAALVEEALDRYGRIDAVVNNTGHAPKGDLLDLTDEDWHAGLDLLVLNVVRMARLVTPIMAQQGHGAIVNVSTFAAVEPRPEFPVSGTLRAALGNFTKLYADRYGSLGIRMNSVLPGFVDSYEVDDATVATIPLGRPATTADVGRVIRFLVSEESKYVTGQSILVDGGLTHRV